MKPWIWFAGAMLAAAFGIAWTAEQPDPAPASSSLAGPAWGPGAAPARDPRAPRRVDRRPGRAGPSERAARRRPGDADPLPRPRPRDRRWRREDHRRLCRDRGRGRGPEEGRRGPRRRGRSDRVEGRGGPRAQEEAGRRAARGDDRAGGARSWTSPRRRLRAPRRTRTKRNSSRTCRRAWCWRPRRSASAPRISGIWSRRSSADTAVRAGGAR